MNPQLVNLTLADQITWHLSDPAGDDRRWRITQFYKVPELSQQPLANTYSTLYTKHGRSEANTYLRKFASHFESINTDLATDDDFANDYAQRRADEFTRLASKHHDPELAYQALSRVTQALELHPPELSKEVTLSGANLRMQSKEWLKRNLIRLHQERFESAAIQAGMVHRFAGIYVSDQSFNAFSKRKARNRRILNSIELENESGFSATLAELAETTVSNPVNRRNELMARLAGFDAVAKDAGHTGLLITMTCPSRMHARYSKSGDPNPKYDGTPPYKAQQYLCRLWARIRAKLKHADIHVYGFRVAEPQHDATPHWHILLFTDAVHEAFIKDLFLYEALQDSPDEAGAKDKRCDFKTIDRAKGSGVGYMAKYISKNIDGKHIETDLNGLDGTTSADRVLAWASIHRIRQFQQFGGATVTCWRELRRADIATEGTIEAARVAADAGDWKQYTMVQGGTDTKRRDHPVKPLLEYSDEVGKYGEPKGYRISGVTDGSLNLVTRLHQWTVKTRSEGSGMCGVSRAH